MQKSYFEMTLEKTIKRAEKLLQKLKSVRELYGERKIETAMKESVSAVKLAEELTLLVRSLPAHTSHPQARELVQSAIRATVPVDIGFTEQGWLCLRMPILLPGRRSYPETISGTFFILCWNSFLPERDQFATGTAF